MADELWKLGAVDLAAAIRSKQASSREVVSAHLDRIAAVNPSLNAITVTLAESALSAADAADAVLASGAQVGPLHGVPFTSKENIDVAGSPTTQGVVAMEHAVASADAAHVARLRAAGAIPLARTNMPDFALRWHTDNALRGATKNPWDASRTPGGSSGGEAASLATGMTPLGLGNDLGGSLRWPSQCCGTAAIKPSLGRVATASETPTSENPLTFQLFAVEGPMARNVRDLRLSLQLMSVPNSRDARYVPAPIAGPEVPRRVAMCIDPAGMGVAPAIAAGVRKAGEMLRDTGYEVEEVDVPMVAEAFQLWARLLLSEVSTVALPILGELLSEDAAKFLSYAIAGAPPFTYPEYMVAWMQRQTVANAWERFLGQYPLLLGPVSTMQPFPVGYDIAGQEQFADVLTAHRLLVTANLLGLPAAVVPVELANGLPQGVQIIGGRYREDLCLDAAEAIESRAGALTPIDPR